MTAAHAAKIRAFFATRTETHYARRFGAGYRFSSAEGQALGEKAAADLAARDVYEVFGVRMAEVPTAP